MSAFILAIAQIVAVVVGSPTDPCDVHNCGLHAYGDRIVSCGNCPSGYSCLYDEGAYECIH